MTRIKAKQASRGPLADKTNVLNMKLNKQISSPTIILETPVKKSGRIRKRKIYDENIYQVDFPKICSKRNKVKKNVLAENDILASIVPNKQKTEDKKELCVEITRIKDTEYKGVINEKGRNNEHVLEIDKTRKDISSDSKSIVYMNFEEKNLTFEEIQEEDNQVDTLELINTFSFKELIVKIPRLQNIDNQVHAVKPKEHCTTHGAAKGVLLNDTTNQSDRSITETQNDPKIITDTDNAKKTSANKEIKCTVSETRVKQADKNAKERNMRGANGEKELFIKITPCVDVEINIEENPTKQRITRRKSVLLNNAERIVENKSKHLFVTGETNKKINKNKESQGKDMKITEVTLGRKQMFVKIPQMVDNDQIDTESDKIFEIANSVAEPIINKATSKKNIKNNEAHKKVKYYKKIEVKNKTMASNVENPKVAKELFVEITQIPNKDNNEIRKQQNSYIQSDKLEKPGKNVKFDLNTMDLKESHNLRNLQIKNYAEESIIDTTKNDAPEEPAQVNLQKKDRVPIYRKIILEEPKINNQSDLYEFTDVSPKKRKVAQRGRLRKSSMLFDKNTHEILQKIEEKEAKTKRKLDRKQKLVPRQVSEKTYDKKVKAIVANVKKKIGGKKGNILETVRQINDNHTVVQNVPNGNVQGSKNVPFNEEYTKVVQVDNIYNEITIDVPHSAKVPLSKIKLVPERPKNLQNVTSRRGENERLNLANNITANVVTNKSHFDRLKESVNVRKPLPLDSISVCSDSDYPDNHNYIDNYCQDEKNVPLPNSHTEIIPVNDFNNEISIIVHHSAEVPLTEDNFVSKKQNTAKNMANVAAHRGAKAQVMPVDNNVVSKGNFNSFNSAAIKNPHLDTFDKLKYVNVGPVIPLQDEPNSGDVDVQSDIDSCFGFDYDIPPVIVSTPNKAVTKKGAVHILENVVIRKGTQDVESPIDFNARRPNANSTMVHFGTGSRTSSPWRHDWVNVRHNPHFISVKGNALPRIDQEPVLDHTLVEGFEGSCTRTPKKRGVTPAKKTQVQQSILEFVEGGTENENVPLQGSLYDYEAFVSPVKKTRKGRENQRVEAVKRNLGNKDNIVSSTPVQRKVLGDISNSSGEQILVNSDSGENTYFGFDESSLPKRTPEKRRNGGRANVEKVENGNVVKPSRFDLSSLRSYAAKNRKNKKVTIAVTEAVQIPNDSISLVEVSNVEDAGQEIRLFEEPEERLDNLSPVLFAKKKHRERLDSCDSDKEDGPKKRKRHKKTKLEVEQEEWIEAFNNMCAEVDQHELELD